MEVSGQFHAPAALLSGKEPPVPIQYEDVWTPEEESFALHHIILSLHLLSYPGSYVVKEIVVQVRGYKKFSCFHNPGWCILRHIVTCISD
jgi:hypothetical protein